MRRYETYYHWRRAGISGTRSILGGKFTYNHGRSSNSTYRLWSDGQAHSMNFWRRRATRAWLAPIAIVCLSWWSAPAHAQGTTDSGSAGPPIVPVSVAQVARGDVPNYLRGLGTVQALQ